MHQSSEGAIVQAVVLADADEDSAAPLTASKLSQVEQALTILAAIVARLAKEVRAGKQRRLEIEELQHRVDSLECSFESGKPAEPPTCQMLDQLQSIRVSLAEIRRRPSPYRPTREFSTL